MSKVIYFSGYVQWLLVSIGRIGGAQKTDVIQPIQKVAVESDAYWGPKFSSNICRNNDEVKNEWGTRVKECGLKNVASNIFSDGVLLYGRTNEQLLAYFRTVLGVLKHKWDTLKLNIFK